MVSRRVLLTLSSTLSLAFHGTLLALSPYIVIHRAATAPLEFLHVFRVQLREDVVTSPPPDQGEAGRGPGLASRPGTITDLLSQETGILRPETSSLANRVDVPLLAERLAMQASQREHDLQQDEATIKEIDAKIIEINETTARRNIEVARRIIHPSSTRILAENEFPVLGGQADEMLEELLTIRPGVPGGSGRGEGGVGTVPGTGAAVAVAAPVEPEAAAIEPSEPALPQLPGEQIMARAPLIEQVRRENPYEFMDNLVDIRVETFLPPGDRYGFFRLQLVPKEGETAPVLPKDVTFVVDASRSITQRKLDYTIEGLKKSLNRLRPEDRFNIVLFRDSASTFQPQPIFATPENKAAALKFLSGQESFGETDVYQAMAPVVEGLPRDGVPSIVLVASDGRPTAGMRDARAIINALTSNNADRNTIFAVGAGKTVNRYLLDLLAYRNKGEARVNPTIEEISRDLPALFEGLSDPLLVDLQADYGRINENEVFPRNVADFYRGRAVTVYGRFDPAVDKELTIRLTGKAGHGKKEMVFRADLAKRATGTSDIARAWAFQKIYYLIGEICRVGETPELTAELHALSRQYQIRTSYTE